MANKAYHLQGQRSYGELFIGPFGAPFGIDIKIYKVKNKNSVLLIYQIESVASRYLLCDVMPAVRDVSFTTGVRK